MSLIARITQHVVELTRLAVPMMVARAGMLIMALVDMTMVGHYSTPELAFQSIGQAPVATLFVTGLGLMMGTSVMAARFYGAGQLHECGMVWRRAVPYALIMGGVMLAICLAGPTILRFLGQPEALAIGGGRVMLVLGLGMPAAMIYTACSFFMEGIKRPMPAMILMVFANLLNVLINWLLVYGHWGFPELGAVGSAWATTGVRCFLALSMLVYIMRLREREKFGLLGNTNARRGWAAGREQRRIGLAAGISFAVESGAFSAVSIYAGWLGEVPLGAIAITINILALVFMAAVGLSSATAVRVGIAMGRRDWPDVALSGWVGLGSTIFLSMIAGVFIWMFPEALISLYSDDLVLRAVALPLVLLMIWVLAADGAQTVMSNALRSRGDVHPPTFMQAFSYLVVMLPLCWFLAFPLGRGAEGLMEGILVASLVAATILTARFYWLARQDRLGVKKRVFPHW